MTGYFGEYLKVAPFSHALWRATEAEIISDLEITKPVLDIGCGFGEFGGIFYKTCVEIGLDKSQKDLDIAKNKGVYEKLVFADAVELPLENNTFSTCVSISTLEHINGADKVIKEVHRVLKNDGVFIFTVPTKEINNRLWGQKILRKVGLKKLADKYIKTYHKVFKHETIVTKEQWERWLQEAGFKKIQVINTLSDKHLLAFETFLITGGSSQILRKITGKRLVWNNPVRTKLMTRLYDLIRDKNANMLNASNVVFIAMK